MVGKGADHLPHGGTGKAVEGAVEQHECLAVGDLLVQHPGDIGAALAHDVAAAFNEDLQLGPLLGAGLVHFLEPLSKTLHIQRLFAGGKGDAQAGAEVGKAQRDAQALLHPLDQGEHVLVVVGQHVGGELLALGVNVDAHDIQAAQVGVPEGSLVDAELAGHALVGGEGEVRVDAHADGGRLALFRGDAADHLQLVEAVSDDDAAAPGSAQIRLGAGGSGEVNEIGRHAPLPGGVHLAQAGGVGTDTLGEHRVQHPAGGVAFHGVEELSAGKVVLQTMDGV